MNLRIERAETDSPFFESWATNFPDKNAQATNYRVYYNNSYVDEKMLIDVDGYRAAIPLPRSTALLSFDHEDINFARIINAGDVLTNIWRQSLIVKKNNCNHKTIYHTANDGDSFAYKALRFDAWTSLRRYLSEWSENHPEGHYMFRGHADSSWSLEPTIDRLGVNSSQVELESLSKFQRGIPVFAAAKDISFLNTPKSTWSG